MKFLLLIYTDDTLLEALPAGAFDQMMHGCITHADELKAQGTLERLELTLDAMGTNPGRDEVTQSAKAQAVVTMFKPSLVETVDLLANGFDPSQWIDGAPRASLNIQAKVQPNADFSQSVGDVSVQNTRPISIQANGLPFSNAKARFELALTEQQPKQFDLWVDALNFADGKRNAGDAKAVFQWRAPIPLKDGKPNPDLMAGDADFKIETRNLDASVFAELPQSFLAMLNWTCTHQTQTK